MRMMSLVAAVLVVGLAQPIVDAVAAPVFAGVSTPAGDRALMPVVNQKNYRKPTPPPVITAKKPVKKAKKAGA
jgi:hypothetical protein